MNSNFNSQIYAHSIILIIILNIIIPIINNLDLNNKGTELFKKYYEDMFKSIIIDFITVYFILNISNKLPDNIPIILRRTIIILLYDVLLSVYINKSSYKIGNIAFLKEWGETVGWFAIIWDLVYINAIGALADKINIKSDNINLLMIGLINIILLHQ